MLLSQSDLSDVQDLLSTTLTLPTPEAESVRGWMRRVLQSTKSLVGADRGFMVADCSAIDERESDYTRGTEARYPGLLEETFQGHNPWRHMVAMGVHSRARLFGTMGIRLHGTEYWEEMVRRPRAYHALGMSWSRAADPSRSDTAQMLLHHESDRRRRFNGRERAIMRLLLPAFRAAMDHVRSGLLIGLESSVDRHEYPCFILTSDGRLLHRNPAATRWVDGSPGVDVLSAIRRIIPAPPVGGGPASPAHAIYSDGNGRRWALSMTRRIDALGGGVRWVAVLSPLEPPQDRVERLAKALGLTRRQTQIALHLSAGMSDRAIAAELRISWHTVRRHVEAVYLRLGVSSRKELAHRVAETRGAQ